MATMLWRNRFAINVQPSIPRAGPMWTLIIDSILCLDSHCPASEQREGSGMSDLLFELTGCVSMQRSSNRLLACTSLQAWNIRPHTITSLYPGTSQTDSAKTGVACPDDRHLSGSSGQQSCRLESLHLKQNKSSLRFFRLTFVQSMQHKVVITYCRSGNIMHVDCL